MRTAELLRAIGILGLLLLARPAAAQPQDDLLRALAAPLRDSRQAQASRPELLGRLVAPGAAAIAPLFDILVEERVPLTTDGDAPQLLSVPQRELLLAALAQLPRECVRSELERRLVVAELFAEPRSSGALRLAALRALSVVGERADLARLPGLAPREHDELSANGAASLRAAYAAILRRDPALISTGFALLRSCDGAAASQLLFAIGDLGDRRALPLLEDCMRSLPAHAQQAVGLLALLGPSDDPSLDRRVAFWLGENLDPERPEWMRACLLALGVFDDGTQIPILLEQLESEHPGLREAALLALRRISGLQLGETAPAWREWYAGERAWLEAGEPAAELELQARSDARVARALGAYAAHRLFRDERARTVLVVLESGSPAMRVLACSTLARLGSKCALPALVESMGDARPALAEAAWRAACELAGEALPRSTAEARARLTLD